jgi:hypothetical protein
MSLVIVVAALVAVTLFYTLFVRAKDIPPPEPVSPTKHLDDRRAAIYENLRDLQFEYRVGKLSDADYQHTKLSLQKELAQVAAEIERARAGGAATPAAVPVAAAVAGSPAQDPAVDTSASAPLPQGAVCPYCGAGFPRPMKFCGECGREMQ